MKLEENNWRNGIFSRPWPSARRRGDSGDGKPGHEEWREKERERERRRKTREGAESTQASNNGEASNPLLRNRRDVNSLSVKSRRDVATDSWIHYFVTGENRIYIFFMRNLLIIIIVVIMQI